MRWVVSPSGRQSLVDFPSEHLTQDILVQQYNGDKIPLHVAASEGSLYLLPKRLLTVETMLHESGVYMTPLAIAAARGHLNQLPQRLLTAENLLKLPDDGKNLVFDMYAGLPRINKSALHFAAEHSHLDQVPIPVLTLHALLAPNAVGVTPLHLVKPGPGGLDALVGVDFEGDVEARKIVGDEWWKQNQTVLSGRAKLGAVSDTVEVELF